MHFKHYFKYQKNIITFLNWRIQINERKKTHYLYYFTIKNTPVIFLIFFFAKDI